MKITCCKIGLHDWKKVYNVNNCIVKVCKKCGKTKGLIEGNIKTWKPIKKIEPDDYGKVKIYKDGAGALFVYNEKTDSCYGLTPYNYLGSIKYQGDVTVIGKYALAYTK